MPNKSDIRVVVAIDFGNTLSGFAYSNRANTEIITNDTWPSEIGLLKTNTVLQYDSNYQNVIKWGNSALAQKPTRRNKSLNFLKPVELFKLHLGNFPRNEKSPLPYQLSYEKTISDYLRELGKLIKETIATRWCGITFFEHVLLVISMPAEFDDYAKDTMRKCIYDAELMGSIKSTRVKFITESEAAAIYCMRNLEQSIPIDASFMVVDCGGETVNITTRKLLQHNKFSEITERVGDFCGGSYVDREFLKFLSRKLGESTINLFRENNYGQMQNMIQQFCRQLKFGFTGNRKDFDFFEFDIDEICPILKQYCKDDTKEKMEDDVWIININFEDLRSMFDPVIGKIIRLIRRQLISNKDKCSAVFLVGGFSESKYLQMRIKEEFEKLFPLIIAPKNPIAAIVRGACDYGLNELSDDCASEGPKQKFNISENSKEENYKLILELKEKKELIKECDELKNILKEEKESHAKQIESNVKQIESHAKQIESLKVEMKEMDEWNKFMKNLSNELSNEKLKYEHELNEKMKYEQERNDQLDETLGEVTKERDELKSILKKERDSHGKQIESNTKQIESSAKQMEALKKEIEEWKYHANVCEIELASEKTKHEQYMNSWKERYDQLEEQLKDYNEIKNILEKEKDSHAKQIESSVKLMEALKKEIEEWKHNVVQYEHKLSQYEHELTNEKTKYEQHMDDWREKYNQLEEQLTNKRKDHNELKNILEKERDSHAKQFESNTKQFESSAKQMEVLIKEIEELKNHVNLYENELINEKTKYEQHMNALRERYDQLEEDYNELYKKNEELNQSALGNSEDMNQYNSLVTELANEKMKYEQHMNAWRERYDQLDEQLKNKRKDYNELYKKNEELNQSALGNSEMNQYNSLVTELANEKMKYEQHMNAWRERYDQLDEQLKNKSKDYNELYKKNEELRQPALGNSEDMNQYKSLVTELANEQMKYEQHMNAWRERYNQLEEQLKNKRDDYNEFNEDLRNEASQYQSTLQIKDEDKWNQYVIQYNNLITELANEKTKYEQLANAWRERDEKKELRVIVKECDDLKKQIETLKEEIEEWKTTVNQYEHELANERDSYAKQIESYKKKLNELEEEKSQSPQLPNKDLDKDKKEKREKLIQELKEEEKRKLVKERDELKRERDSYAKQIESYEKKLNELEESSQLPQLPHKELSKDKREKREKLIQEVREKEKRELIKERDELKKDRDDYAKQNKSYENQLEEIKLVQELKEKGKRELIKERDNLKNERDSYVNQIESYKKQLNEFEREKPKLPPLPNKDKSEKREKLINEIREKEKRELMNERDDLKREKEFNTKQIKALKKEIDEWKYNVNQYEHKLGQYEHDRVKYEQHMIALDEQLKNKRKDYNELYKKNEELRNEASLVTELGNEKMKYEQHINTWREKYDQLEEKLENKRKDYNELYKKSQELRHQYLGDVRNNDTNNLIQLTKDLEIIQDKINEFCKLKGGIGINEQSLALLLKHYNCKQPEPGDKVLLRAALQRLIIETILRKTDEYLQTQPKEISNYLMIQNSGKVKEKYLELNVLNSTNEYLSILNNLIHSRKGTDEVSFGVPKKIRQLVYSVLGDRGFGSNDEEEHEFIQEIKNEIIMMMNNYRTIKKAEKKQENEDMIADIIRDVIKMFIFRLRVLEPPGELEWITKDSKLDLTLMEIGNLEDESYEIVNLCFFPLIYMKSETGRKVLVPAKIMAIEAE